MNKGLRLWGWMLLLLLGLVPVAGAEGATVRFSDANWDSVKFHNAVAGRIAEGAFGLRWEEVPGSTTILHEAIQNGDVDVNMEAWTDNIATYSSALAEGAFVECGINFDDNAQGFYVPRYVIEGDAERGIEAVAPDLKTVQDLAKYASVFADEEEVGKGRIYGAIPGWAIDDVMQKKVAYYGLDAQYRYVSPGSEAALAAAFTAAYSKGEPIVGYYWEPTWLMGLYDFVLLEDAPYEAEGYLQGETACPSVKVTVVASNAFAKAQPEYVAFLKNYHTSSALTNEALAHIQETGDSYTETAEWFLRNHEELLDAWLTVEQASAMRSSLGLDGEVAREQAVASSFPLELTLDLERFDRGVKQFAKEHDGFFSAIKQGLVGFVMAIDTVLSWIPWWLFVGAVMLLSWRNSHRWAKSLLYGLLLFAIGLFGLWDAMNETLAVVLAAVLLALCIGFPIGVLLSGSPQANRLMRPVLDTMQTMPVFVYLIPAVMFFGIGKAPAVLATVIYAVVPVIRLTALGILQVDHEVVEAARSFGGTRWQILWKVQIPQAMPTILTGVNQTLMMAMAMVVTCSMIGASGLGTEVLMGVNRNEMGRGLLAGTAVVIVAILMDRLTQESLKSGKKGE